MFFVCTDLGPMLFDLDRAAEIGLDFDLEVDIDGSRMLSMGTDGLQDSCMSKSTSAFPPATSPSRAINGNDPHTFLVHISVSFSPVLPALREFKGIK